MRLLITTQVVDRTDSNLGFFHRWLEEFAKHCEQVTVVCLREGEHNLPKNVEVLSLGKERGTSRLTRIFLFYNYIISRRHSYDAVFVHMNPEYVVLGGPLWRLWHKRVMLWYVHKSVTLKLRVAALFANNIVTASKESFRLPTHKLTVVGHGIDTALFKPHLRSKDSIIRIVTVGRISESKKLVEMLDVLDFLYNRGRSFVFTIVGAPITPVDKLYMQKLQAMIATRPFKENIAFTGGIPYLSLPALLQTQDVFLNFSVTGSIDKAILDALAAGVPVVTSNEAFKDSALVRYYPLKSDLIAEAIEELFNSPPDPQTLSFAVAKDYGLSQCISRIMALYEHA